MKSFSIINDDLNYEGLGLSLNRITIAKSSIPFALIELEPPQDDGLGDEMVLVKKTAFSVNYRDKALCIDFLEKLKDNPSKVNHYPIGSEFAGVVERVGSNVKNLRPGDRVMPNHEYPLASCEEVAPGIPSNHSSFEYQPFHYCKLTKIPDNMEDEVAAGFSLNAQTAYSMIRRTGVGKEDNVLVTSATSNASLFTISALLSQGIPVSVITTTLSACRTFQEIGVKKVYYYDTAKDFDDPSQDWAKDEATFDVVFDPLHDIYLLKILLNINSNGRYVTCGTYNQFGSSSEQEVDADISSVVGHLITRNISLVGNCLGTTQDLEDAIADYASGKLRVFIDSVHNENSVSEFLERSFNSKERFGKVVFSY